MSLHRYVPRLRRPLDGNESVLTRRRHYIGLRLLIAGLVLAGGGGLQGISAQAASDGIGGLSLPWASGTSWLFNGPHSWGGNGIGPWNSLDLEGTAGGHVAVLAASNGIVHLDGWAKSCGYVRIDQGDGWQT